MARKAPKFVNIKLGGIMRMRYKDCGVDVDDWPFALEKLTDDGYTVTVRHDLDSDSFSVSVTDRLEKSINENICINCWTSSIGQAMSDLCTIITLAAERETTWELTFAELKAEGEIDTDDFIKYLHWKENHKDEKPPK